MQALFSSMRVFLRLVWLLELLCVAVTAVNPSLNDDVLGLIVFKADIRDPKGKLASWNEDDESACGGSWVGVKCNPRSNRVVEVNLDGFSLSGRIGRGLQRLQFLRKLSLANNNLTGGINPNIARIDNLRVIDLSGNSLSGEVSEDVFRQCGSLRTVSLARNRFSGSIPSTLGACSALAAIDLSNNQFSGSVPSRVWSLSALRSLDLSDNLLEGEIPKGIEAMKNLRSVSVARNRLTGNVPYGFGSCLLLRSIDLGDNSFSGSIPGDFKELTLCGYISLRGNAFSGGVPQWIGEMRGLETLDLSNNGFTGQVPSSIGNLQSLKMLNFSGNGLTGSLPESMANCTKLLVLDVSRNSMSGWLPLWVFKSDLDKVLVSENVQSGSKKSPLFAMAELAVQSLQVLDLSHNAFSGEITSAVGGLSSLQVLNLANNSLGGPIPPAVGEPDFSSGAHALLNKDCELGRGGFGAVYQTVLRDGHSVAIKKLTVSSLVKSQEDFEREVKKLGKIRHQNLVELEGYYWTPSLQLLIYEYLSGGSLYKHLHEGSGGNFLSWNERFNVILGTAKALAHLHHSNIIHYNIKSTNVLLDSYGEPKVGDFGLARLLPMLDRYVLSSKIQSALGYMAPEFACKTVKITEKCDVYGFGVLVLEIVTGKRPVEYMEDDVVVLCDMVRGALEEGRVEECIDERLQGKFPAEEAIPVMKLGLICTSQVPSNRPDMGEVVNILELIRCPSEGQEELA
uniref:Protein kinase domain-containing protein n=1 Tax=Glycine max TaxID=3847 RepID=A0A0R0KG42_SOYBN